MPPWAGVQQWEYVTHGLDGGSRQCCALADVKVHQPTVVIAITAASIVSPQPVPAFHAVICERVHCPVCDVLTIIQVQ